MWKTELTPHRENILSKQLCCVGVLRPRYAPVGGVSVRRRRVLPGKRPMGATVMVLLRAAVDGRRGMVGTRWERGGDFMRGLLLPRALDQLSVARRLQVRVYLLRVVVDQGASGSYSRGCVGVPHAARRGGEGQQR